VINKSGITIRIGVDTLRVMGRATQGVKIIKLRDNDSIASVAKVSKFEDEEGVLLDEEGNIIETPEVIKGEEVDSSDATNEDDSNENNENQNEEN